MSSLPAPHPYQYRLARSRMTGVLQVEVLGMCCCSVHVCLYYASVRILLDRCLWPVRTPAFYRAQVAAKDSKLDRVESQMLDSYDNDKKVAVLGRIQVGPTSSPDPALTASVPSAPNNQWFAVAAARSKLQLDEVGAAALELS